MDSKRRYIHTLGPDSLDIFNSNEAQNLAQIWLHVIPGFPRTRNVEPDQNADRPLGAGDGAAYGLRAGVVDVG